jgi:hypothetical protein
MAGTSFWRRASGVAVVVFGIVMIPLPGPGWPILIAGLAMLGWSPRALLDRVPAGWRSRLPGWSVAPAAV